VSLSFAAAFASGAAFGFLTAVCVIVLIYFDDQEKP
jgi:hypothetical protein